MKNKMQKRDQRPLALWILIVLIAFNSLSGLWGGIAFLIDPTGGLMNFPQETCDRFPLPNFLIPGIFLLLVYGIGGAVTILGLLRLPDRHLSVKSGWWRSRHWSWFFSLALGIILIVWIVAQIMIIGGPMPIQIVYGTIGIYISGCALLPRVRRYALPSADVA
ncbi:MAG: hypothetical protein PHI18_08355 [bacterium]|nr:hypothetical protein [bacterium]